MRQPLRREATSAPCANPCAVRQPARHDSTPASCACACPPGARAACASQAAAAARCVPFQGALHPEPRVELHYPGVLIPGVNVPCSHFCTWWTFGSGPACMWSSSVRTSSRRTCVPQPGTASRQGVQQGVEQGVEQGVHRGAVNRHSGMEKCWERTRTCNGELRSGYRGNRKKGADGIGNRAATEEEKAWSGEKSTEGMGKRAQRE
eukprot:350372-Chlamydomonas_euryale.AAC.9